MNETHIAADDVSKLLDNGYVVSLFRNDMGSYTAVAVASDGPRGADLGRVLEAAMSIESLHGEDRMTDDFTPSQALYRLTEKVTTGRIVGE